jgi:predicted nucleotidyltransferase
VVRAVSGFEERDGTLYRPDEEFEPYVSPQGALERGVLPDGRETHVLQNRVHYALADYLNGGTPHSLSVARSILSDHGVTAGEDPCSVVAAYFEHAGELMPAGTAETAIDPGPFDPTDYRADELARTVAEMVDEIRDMDEYLAGAYLHGSFGDGDYVRNYSDVDLLLVVNRATLTDPTALAALRDRLADLRQYYYYVDPHQHHGVMIVGEPTLSAYNRAYLPPVALDHGRSLLDPGPVTVGLRADRLERRHGFWRVLQTLRRTVDDGQFPSSFDGKYLTVDGRGPLYALKHFTSVVQLLPSLYATAAGDPIHKIGSFSLPVFDRADGDLDAVDRCSRVRELYPDVVNFDRSEAYRTALAADPEAARQEYQPWTVPDEIWDVLSDDYFDAALTACEFLWTEIQSN